MKSNWFLRLFLISFASLGVVFFSYSLGTIQFFTASYQGADIKLEWRLDSDNSVDVFEISRKRPDEVSYTRLDNVMINGTGAYTFVDDKLYKSAQVATISYRLMMKTPNGTTSYYTSIAHNPTAVQRTWGSIKSMFK
jgi:hypothetical protein